MPWSLKQRWLLCKDSLNSIMISHNWREANMVADAASKRGASMQMGYMESWTSKPGWITKWEQPGVAYTRICH
ncbi:hypothetical protein ACHQM5_013626 [Ranunculus cassubicifolius]